MSLLLESLKKAALEKQKKEKSSPKTETIETITLSIESDEQKTDTIKNQKINPEKNEEAVVFNSDEFEFVVEDGQTTELESAEAIQDVAIEKDIYDINQPEIVKTENQQPDNPESENRKVEVKSPEIDEVDQKTEIKPVAEVKSDHQDKKHSVETHNHPVRENRIPGFTPESGKAALAALLEKNKKIEKSGKTRSIYMIALLLLTGIGTLGGYYYFLMDSNSTLSTNQMQLYSHGNNQSALNGAAANESAMTDATTENVSAESTDPAPADTQETTAIIPAETNTDPEFSAIESQTPIPRINKSVENTQINKASEDINVKKPDSEKTTQTSRVAVSNSKPVAVNSQPIESYIQSQPAVEDAIAQQVNAAYQAYQQGQWTEAQLLYQKVLMMDTYNRDALLGAAAVAVRQGKPQEALGYYQQQLERDPQDEYAISGIMSLGLDANKSALLSEIDRRLQDKPANVHLLFLKASILAGQQQWSAAQQSFFEAWNHDKKNADIVYNLAICLDRLNQPREAIRFYQMALSLKTASTNFSTTSVEKRLARLTESTP